MQDGPVLIQSPAIGNALRTALSLDAAGSMGLDMGPTVHPVCIVGDVRAQLDSAVRSFSGYRNVPAAAAQFGKIALEVPTTAFGAGLIYAVPRRIQLYINAGATVYWRLGSNTPPAGTDAPTRSLNSRLAGAAGTCRVIGGSDGVAVAPGTMQGIVQLNAGTQREWNNIPEMRLYADPATAQTLVFYSDTALVQLVGEVIWDEYYRS